MNLNILQDSTEFLNRQQYTILNECATPFHPFKIQKESSDFQNYYCDNLYIDNTQPYSNELVSSDIYDNQGQFTQLPYNMALQQQKKTVIDETKFKTEMCKNWTETGKCNYGKKCKFAHGKQELYEKPIPNKNRYKSKECNSFHTQMFCPYGQRCLFIHDNRNCDEIKRNYFYQKILCRPELLDQYPELRMYKKRLPFFIQIHRKNALEESVQKINQFELNIIVEQNQCYENMNVNKYNMNDQKLLLKEKDSNNMFY